VDVALHVGSESAVLTVTDDGPGISADVLPRLFTPFFTTKVAGTGLGLSIVHSIVSEHRGETTVDSQPGKGACFTVRIPLLASIPPSSISTPGPDPSGVGHPVK
jgi:signal transduction histidine kinase